MTQQKNDQARGILAKLRLEPAVFLFFTCFGLFFASSQQLYIEKACKVYSLFIVRCTREKMSDTLAKTNHNKINHNQVNLGHNASICDNLEDFPDVQIETQKLVAGVQVGN